MEHKARFRSTGVCPTSEAIYTAYIIAKFYAIATLAAEDNAPPLQYHFDYDPDRGATYRGTTTRTEGGATAIIHIADTG